MIYNAPMNEQVLGARMRTATRMLSELSSDLLREGLDARASDALLETLFAALERNVARVRRALVFTKARAVPYVTPKRKRDAGSDRPIKQARYTKDTA